MSARQWRAEHARHVLGDLANRDVLTAADIEHLAGRTIDLEREPTRSRYIFDVHEVAALVTVFEHERWFVIEEPRREDREHTRVWIRQRLARTVDVEEAQRDGRNLVRRSRH